MSFCASCAATAPMFAATPYRIAAHTAIAPSFMVFVMMHTLRANAVTRKAPRRYQQGQEPALHLAAWCS